MSNLNSAPSELLSAISGVYFNTELELLFQLSQIDGELSARSIRHGNIPLTFIGENNFMGKGALRSIRITRDSSDQIDGFDVVNSRGEMIYRFTKAS